jgi:hypothetical protein
MCILCASHSVDFNRRIEFLRRRVESQVSMKESAFRRKTLTVLIGECGAAFVKLTV